MGYVSNWLRSCMYDVHMDPLAGKATGIIETPKGYKWHLVFENTATLPPGSTGAVGSNYELSSLELEFPKPLLFGHWRKIKII